MANQTNININELISRLYETRIDVTLISHEIKNIFIIINDKNKKEHERYYHKILMLLL